MAEKEATETETETKDLPLVAVVTISDRASAGVYQDESGPRVCQVLKEYIATPCRYELICIPDEQPVIERTIKEFCERDLCGLVVTTGGTGPAPRDVTPEAIEKVCAKLLPGFGEEMRRASLLEGVPTAILSRQTAGKVKRSEDQEKERSRTALVRREREIVLELEIDLATRIGTPNNEGTKCSTRPEFSSIRLSALLLVLVLVLVCFPIKLPKEKK